MADCAVDMTRVYNGSMPCQAGNSIFPLPNTAYANGPGLEGGACGEWLTFMIHKRQSFNSGLVRLFLSGDQDFNSFIFMGKGLDDRDVERTITSCRSIRLMDGSNPSVHSFFKWDVCYVDGTRFRVRYRIQRKGRFKLHVKLDGNSITGSPFDVFISDGCVNVLRCRVNGKGVERCIAIPTLDKVERLFFSQPKDPLATIEKDKFIESLYAAGFVNKIALHICDAASQTVENGLPHIKAWGTDYAKVIKIKELPKGTVEILYVVTVPSDGLARLSASTDDCKIAILPTFMRRGTLPCSIYIEINGEGIFGSPFTPRVENVHELEQYYDTVETPISRVKYQFSRFLEQRNFDKCISLYKRYRSHPDIDEIRQGLQEILEARHHQTANSAIDIARHSKDMDFIHCKNLGRFHGIVEDKYQQMFKYKTASIVECVRELNNAATARDHSNGSRGFNNLGDVILNYRRIGDELRKLHRFELAKKFDVVNDQLCEEVELGRWQAIVEHKEAKVSEMKKTMQEYTKKLKDFKAKIETKYSKITDEEIKEFKKTYGCHVDKAQQTMDQEVVTSRMSKLIESRCNTSPNASKLDLIVEKFWRRSNTYDIHVNIVKILKSSIRLKNAIHEMFLYYAGAEDFSKKDTGVSRPSAHIFVLEARVCTHLCRNKQKIDWLFDKFSTIYKETSSNRVVPQHLWCAFLRELGYLNLLYTIAESANLDLLRDSNHPSRLVSFHHFCEVHLVPLYERLYLNKYEFQKYIKTPLESLDPHPTSDAKNTTPLYVHHFFTHQRQLADYIKNNVPQVILTHLPLEVLQIMFKHYSRIAMFARGPVPAAWFTRDSWISKSTLVVLSKDFSIVPGFMDGSKVIEVATHVTRNAKLLIKDFVDSMVNILSYCINKICSQKEMLYSAQNAMQAAETQLPPCMQSEDTVNQDVVELLATLGITNKMTVVSTIEALYGHEAAAHLKTYSLTN